tara:strand:- start:158 stop:364 length:207 start_codon:yes stop_codon:yes gene_type:complete
MPHYYCFLGKSCAWFLKRRKNEKPPSRKPASPKSPGLEVARCSFDVMEVGADETELVTSNITQRESNR